MPTPSASTPRPRSPRSTATVVFPGVALDAEGAPVPVMHSDDGFVLLFTAPSSAYLEQAAARILRPFPAGLATPAGLVVANPAFCPTASRATSSRPAHYHGTVVWSWQHALLAAGLRRQLARADLPLRTRASLSMANGVLDGIIRALVRVAHVGAVERGGRRRQDRAGALRRVARPPRRVERRAALEHRVPGAPGLTATVRRGARAGGSTYRTATARERVPEGAYADTPLHASRYP